MYKDDLNHSYHTVNICPQFVIMVIDSTDRQRLGISREELHRMLTHEELSRACLLVFANKQVTYSNSKPQVLKIIFGPINSRPFEILHYARFPSTLALLVHLNTDNFALASFWPLKILEASQGPLSYLSNSALKRLY